MFRQSWILITGLAAATAVYAGGFFVKVHTQSDGLVVRAEGCRDYSRAKVAGRAEGVVNGKRQSIVLNLTAGANPGTYSVRKQWPSEGKWVLVFSGTSGALVTHTIVELRPNGTIEPHMYMRPLQSAEVEALLADSGV
jgi:hypothetical protein